MFTSILPAIHVLTGFASVASLYGIGKMMTKIIQDRGAVSYEDRYVELQNLQSVEKACEKVSLCCMIEREIRNVTPTN